MSFLSGSYSGSIPNTQQVRQELTTAIPVNDRNNSDIPMAEVITVLPAPSAPPAPTSFYPLNQHDIVEAPSAPFAEESFSFSELLNDRIQNLKRIPSLDEFDKALSSICDEIVEWVQDTCLSKTNSTHPEDIDPLCRLKKLLDITEALTDLNNFNSSEFESQKERLKSTFDTVVGSLAKGYKKHPNKDLQEDVHLLKNILRDLGLLYEKPLKHQARGVVANAAKEIRRSSMSTLQDLGSRLTTGRKSSIDDGIKDDSSDINTVPDPSADSFEIPTIDAQTFVSDGYYELLEELNAINVTRYPGLETSEEQLEGIRNIRKLFQKFNGNIKGHFQDHEIEQIRDYTTLKVERLSQNIRLEKEGHDTIQAIKVELSALGVLNVKSHASRSGSFTSRLSRLSIGDTTERPSIKAPLVHIQQLIESVQKVGHDIVSGYGVDNTTEHAKAYRQLYYIFEKFSDAKEDFKQQLKENSAEDVAALKKAILLKTRFFTYNYKSQSSDVVKNVKETKKLLRSLGLLK